MEKNITAAKAAEKVLIDFWQTFLMEHCEETLWIYLKATFTEESIEDTDTLERHELFAFYENLLRLLRATLLIYKKGLLSKTQAGHKK